MDAELVQLHVFKIPNRTYIHSNLSNIIIKEVFLKAIHTSKNYGAVGTMVRYLKQDDQ